MEKLPICRICLVENVRMFIVVNRNLHKLYEKLTDIPFVTEDSRPILACFFCCAKLKQCYQLLKQCQEAEELFAQMKEDYEPNSLINQNHKKVFSGFIKSPIWHISIVDECQTESIAIKEELPADCEGFEEHLSDELEPEHFDKNFLHEADISPQNSESDLLDDELLIYIKNEVEEDQEVSKKKLRARETKRASVAKKPKLERRETKLEDTRCEQTKTEKSFKVIRITQKHLPTITGAPAAVEKTNLVTRRIKIEEAITAVQKKHEMSEYEINQKSRTSTPVTKFKEPSDTKHEVNNSYIEHFHILTGAKSFKCGICHCCFSHKGHLTRHLRMHTGEKPYKCEVCQRSFSQFSNLKRHSRIHTDEKPYKCDLCHRCFNDKRDLSKHIRIHNGEKPFKCDICQLSFNDKRVIIKHIRKHTGEKPVKCDLCQRSFSYSCDLKKHVRIHTGEKPYKCDICQRGFNIKGNLKKHFRIHAGEKHALDNFSNKV